ncbi:ATP-binding cassette subfamily B protein RaxB [Luteibacter sp. OK325]|uniref:peptidase domain-containing ABC transporter n=1 Tax=Luteibacter sp. OK325 TaxID=2135670 RepID=UPI000D4897FE|nr:peptidase domain-containing ABC transporter [Luteibacter sp. OK325]PTR28424.1 ATP-binding cassette subfamily B protein RaxB [Luteibacter sp. OK325]
MITDGSTPLRNWKLPRKFGARKETPVIRQSEQAECGMACLAMILGHHGHHISLRDLREKTNLSSRGATLNDVITVAETHGLQCRPLRLELSELQNLQTPCILHWKLDHFVILTKASRNRVTIIDPAAGRMTLRLLDVSHRFTGVALQAAPADTFAKIKGGRDISLSSVIQMLRGYAPSLRSILAFSLALEVLALLMPQLVQIIVDQVLANGDYDLLTLVGIGFVLLTALHSSLSACRSWSVAWMTAHGSMHWTGAVFHRLLRLQQSYFERRHVGDVVSRVDAMRTIQQGLTSQLIGAAMDGVVGMATLGFLLIYSPLLAGIVASATTAYAVVRAVIYRRLREASINQIESEAAQRTDLVESIRGIQAIRLNNKTAIRSAIHANKTATVLAHQFQGNRIAIMFEAIGSLVSGLQRVAVLWVGASLVVRGQMTAGMLMAISAYADQFSARSNALIDYLVQLRLLLIQADRVADIALSPEEANIDGCYQGPNYDPSIAFRDVSYRYSTNSPWILRNASLFVSPGEPIAIIGPSGVGKSTTLRLLLGLIDPCEGTIVVGGVDLARLGKASFRDKVGVVLQDDHLFSGTVADNICFFDPVANMNDLYEAARRAEIHDDICAMPMGYRTLVGDMGSSLSGGQRQRIVLARALFRKPAMLVLDEATSHLDLAAESRIASTLKDMKVTRIIIAHRPETIRTADRCVTLIGGRFIEDIHP